MRPAHGLDLRAIGEALGPSVRGAAELRPWLPARGPASASEPFVGVFETPRPSFLGAALLEVKDGARALEVWRRIRVLSPKLGALPVIVGSAEDVAAVEARFAGEDPKAAALRLAVELDAATRFQGSLASEGNYTANPHHAVERIQAVEAVALSESELEPREESFLFVDELDEHAFVALLPETSPSLLPAHLRFGGGRPVPELVATLRRWERRVGPIDVVYAGAATLELELSHAPTSAADVRALALEHFWLCPALVEQGSGSLDKLVRQLAGSRRWAFWWD